MANVVSDLARLKKRVTEVVAIDFFSAPGRVSAEAALTALEKRLRSGEKKKPPELPSKPDRRAYKGRTWVTSDVAPPSSQFTFGGKRGTRS